MLDYILLAAIALSLLLFYFIDRNNKRLTQLSEKYRLSLPVKANHRINVHQDVLEYTIPPSLQNKVSDIFTTLSISKSFDPISLFDPSHKDYLIINVVFTSAMQNFYIFHQKRGFNHLGKSLSTPYLLNKTKYSILGSITDNIYKFAEKYNFYYFFNSYIPESTLVLMEPKNSFLEIKIDTKDITESFFNDLFKIIEEAVPETPKKFERIVKDYKVKKSKIDAEEKMGFFEKVSKNVKEMQKQHSK